MTEPISAFAAYLTTGKKAARKSNQKKYKSGSITASKSGSKGRGVVKGAGKFNAKMPPKKGKSVGLKKAAAAELVAEPVTRKTKRVSTATAAAGTTTSPSKTAISPSKTAASSSKTTASSSKTAASSSKTTASSSKTAASSSKTAASSSKTAASPSKTAASSSKTAASSSKTAASPSKTAAATNTTIESHTNKSPSTSKQANKNKSPAKLKERKSCPVAGTTKSPTKSKERKSSPAAGTTKTPAISYGFKDSLIDTLFKELLSISPRKLTKAQVRQKKEFETYLAEKAKPLDAEGDHSDAADNGDGKSDDDSGSDSEFSSEYTLSGSTDDSEEGEEQTDETTGDDDGESESSESSSGNPMCSSYATKLAVQTKRKSDVSAAETNGISEAKKLKSLTAGTKNNSNTARKTSLQAGGSAPASPSKITAKRVAVVESVKLEPLSPPSNDIRRNSIAEGLKAFRWLLQPVTENNFFENYWEKGALFVRSRPSNIFATLLSFETIDQMLLQNHIEFTKNIDVTSYKNGVRDTLNPEGRALPPVVWDFYGQGCSLRLLNPQTYIPALYTLNTTLQEFFHCLVGANVYLTPPNSQGFAPHYDDIEAFVLQVEGRKRWKLYQPFEQGQVLSRFSSPNFEQKEIGKPIFDEVLKPGDLLYFPRGTIHQACTEPGYHSLHITLSVYQKRAYADLFESMLPIILKKAISNNVDMRRGLPLHTFQNAGVAFSSVDTKERLELLLNVKRLMKKLLDVPLDDFVDSAVDQLAKKYHREALPPEIIGSERIRTVYGSRSTTSESGECICDYDIDLRTNVRLLRANILRLVEEEGQTRIYYHLDNSKEYCQYDATFIEIDPIEAGSVEVLLKSYPEYVGVSQLPLSADDHKIQVATALWERGFLMLEKPFRPN